MSQICRQIMHTFCRQRGKGVKTPHFLWTSYMESPQSEIYYPVPISNSIALLADVDTPEPDEKSIITYVSQLYDVFPEPPPGHPLFDEAGQKKLQQFREMASSLHHWIKEHIVVMQDRNFPNTLIEMKRLVQEP